MEFMVMSLLLTPKVEKNGLHVSRYNSREQMNKPFISRNNMESYLILPKEADNGRHAYYLYVVRHPRRDEIMEKLPENNIFVNISYPWPIHTMTGYEYLGWKEGSLPVTEAAAKEIFSLPMYPSLTNEEIYLVFETLHRILKCL